MNVILKERGTLPIFILIMKWIMDSTRKTFHGAKPYILGLFIAATYSIKVFIREKNCALIFPVPSFLEWGDGLLGKRSCYGSTRT